MSRLEFKFSVYPANLATSHKSSYKAMPAQTPLKSQGRIFLAPLFDALYGSLKPKMERQRLAANVY